jgi:hypothetical protein
MLYFFKSALIFRNMYDEDAAREVKLWFRQTMPRPYRIAASNTKNAFIWTSTRFLVLVTWFSPFHRHGVADM